MSKAAEEIAPPRLAAALRGASFSRPRKHDFPDHHALQAWAVAVFAAAGRRPAAIWQMITPGSGACAEDFPGAATGATRPTGVVADGAGRRPAGLVWPTLDKPITRRPSPVEDESRARQARSRDGPRWSVARVPPRSRTSLHPAGLDVVYGPIEAASSRNWRTALRHAAGDSPRPHERCAAQRRCAHGAPDGRRGSRDGAVLIAGGGQYARPGGAVASGAVHAGPGRRHAGLP